MKIQINFGDVDHSDALEARAMETIAGSLELFEERVTRVEVHLRDDKSARDGANDMRCTIEVRLAGFKPLAVEDNGHDLYEVIKSASGKAERAVRKKLERRDER